MKETKKITAGLDVKLNKSASLYHCIRYFIKMIQGETEPKITFKFRFNNIYITIELASGDNILYIKQLANNGINASTKGSKVQIDQMKAMYFLISAYQKR